MAVLKIRLKVERLLKPDCMATSVMDRSGCSSSLSAYASLLLIRYS